MGCMYRITFPSGKAYIGITSETAEERFREHAYNATRAVDRGLYRAIRKYGKDSARLETLVIASDWKYLCELERRSIAAFKTKGPHGYNMTDGGEGALGYRHTPESLIKMGAIHKGKAHHNMPHTPESKAKMSASRIGRRHTEEAKKKIGDAARGNKHCLGREIPDDERERRSIAQRGVAKGASSGQLGVSFHRGTGKWRAHLTVRGKYIHLGYHATIEEAINARKDGEARWT